MSEITELASRLFNPKIQFRPRILPCGKRIRGMLDGQTIFDTTNSKLVWEHRGWPTYWIPRTDFLAMASFEDDKPISGIQSSTSRLSVGPKTISTLLVADSFNSELAGYVKIVFEDLEAWFEEQVQLNYHPKDPFHRVDVLPSSRVVRVEIDGVELANTKNEGGVMSLWETKFAPRWYLPRTAVNWTHLHPSTTHTGCPYKGEASYYNATINGKEYKDVVWWYRNPLVESAGIVGMLCFYPDKVDLWVDGVKIAKEPALKRPQIGEFGNGLMSDPADGQGHGHDHQHRQGNKDGQGKQEKLTGYESKTCNC